MKGKKTKNKKETSNIFAKAPEINVVVLGANQADKSGMVLQFVQGVFAEKYEPTVEDSYRKQIEVDGKDVRLKILDITGAEAFTSMRDLYFKNGHVFILVYSIIDRSTFDELLNLREQILRVKDKGEVPMVIVGNRCDLDDQRVIATEQGEDLARKFKVPFFECSAKTGVNVESAFHEATRLASAHMASIETPNTSSKRFRAGSFFSRKKDHISEDKINQVVGRARSVTTTSL